MLKKHVCITERGTFDTRRALRSHWSSTSDTLSKHGCNMKSAAQKSHGSPQLVQSAAWHCTALMHVFSLYTLYWEWLSKSLRAGQVSWFFKKERRGAMNIVLIKSQITEPFLNQDVYRLSSSIRPSCSSGQLRILFNDLRTPAVRSIIAKYKYHHWSIGKVIVWTNHVVKRIFFICTSPLVKNMEKSQLRDKHTISECNILIGRYLTLLLLHLFEICGAFWLTSKTLSPQTILSCSSFWSPAISPISLPR